MWIDDIITNSNIYKFISVTTGPTERLSWSIPFIIELC
jgi:hypothetical protein